MVNNKNKDNMKPHSFREVTDLDNALYQLAVYEVSNGLVLTPRTMEEYSYLQEEIIRKFNYFKRYIQNNECGFEFLRYSILDKNGPFGNIRVVKSNEEIIEEILTKSYEVDVAEIDIIDADEECQNYTTFPVNVPSPPSPPLLNTSLSNDQITQEISYIDNLMDAVFPDVSEEEMEELKDKIGISAILDDLEKEKRNYQLEESKESKESKGLEESSSTSPLIALNDIIDKAIPEENRKPKKTKKIRNPENPKKPKEPKKDEETE